MNLYKTIVNFIPGVLIIPFWIGSLLYLIFLPEITYYALGIMLNIWIPSLATPWGYLILIILLAIPLVNVALTFLLTIQSFWVLFKFLIGAYYPRDELLGFVTMYPASVVVISFIVAFIQQKIEDSSASSSSSSHIPPLPRNDNASDEVNRGEDSTAARASRETSSSDTIKRGEDSKAAKAARSSASSDRKSRGEESTAAQALKASSSSSTSPSESDDLYFDNRENRQKENPSVNNSDEDQDEGDDLYFDNRVNK